MASRADIFDESEQWRGPLAASAVFHALLFSSTVIYGFFFGGEHGENWGGATSGGGAMMATLVSSAAVPLPAREAPRENIVATENPGLAQSQPREREAPPEDAVEIAEPKKAKPQERTRTIAEEKPRPQKDNLVPFGEGGPVSGPFTVFKTDNSAGGMQFGGGDFGARYAWYVEAVRRKVSANWLKYEVDPNIRSAERTFLTFEILRDGRPANVQISKSSGVPSLDQSAVRALQRIDTFGPLPSDYSGSRVKVEFWFDYKR